MTDQALGKLEIAGLHAQAALQMMAVGCNAFSVHLPVMACRELVSTVAAKRGITMPLDLDNLVRPERLPEWRRATVKAYNFLKHADRDTTDTLPASDLARIEQLNDMEMIANISHLSALGYSMPRAYWGFPASIALIYPDIMNWEATYTDVPQLEIARKRLSNISRATIMKALRIALTEAGHLAPA